MPLVFGLASSYSPLLYRSREHWPAVRVALVGDVTQPTGFARETADVLDAYQARLEAATETAKMRLARADIETLIVLGCDHTRSFDLSNTPQLHVFAGERIWGDAARGELGEPGARTELQCDAELAKFLAEEIVGDGFDVAESREEFRPLGDPQRGLDASFIEPIMRYFDADPPPIVPIHVNCSVEPCISAHRMGPFGQALSRALTLVPKRVGILASGGLSGHPGGSMAGWIDEVLDRWVLGRLRTGRAQDTARLFDVESLTLHGATREIRLWTAIGAAMEAAGRHAESLEYLPLHHSAVGCALMIWE